MAKHKFQKGNPGGPGRPKGGNLDWCREFIEKKGKAILEKLAQSDDGAVATKAITLIMAYGYGRPTEHHDITSGGRTLIEILAEVDEHDPRS